MKILYVCHRFPFPPKRGGKIRPFNMIRHLTAGGHKVTVCSLSRALEEAVEAQGIAPFCEKFKLGHVKTWMQILRMVLRLPTLTPSSMGFFYSSELQRQIDSLLTTEKWDLIFVHCSSVAQYVENVRGTLKILDFGDMDSHKWLEYASYKLFPLSLGYHFEGAKMMAAEKKLAKKFDLCTTTTRAEWETLNSYGTGADTDWFPNGVDAGYFCPSDQTYDPDTISFIGRMDYYPNQECMFRFCADTWPLLKAKRPGIKLLIVGADPPPSVLKLAEIPGVTVTGSVPDVRPFVRTSALMVAPLNIARGTQNKILEAMAMGVPVVTSSVAAGGIDAVASEHFLVADSPQTCARAILSILENPSIRQRLSTAGRARMHSHHAWPSSLARLDAIIAHGQNKFFEKDRLTNAN